MAFKKNGQVNRRKRNKNVLASVDPYESLASDVIISALFIVSDQATASKDEIQLALEFLQSEKCVRWADTIGVDLEAALNHKNSKIKVEI